MSEQTRARKRERRAELRRVRATIDTSPERTERLWARVRAMPEVSAARVVMAYRALPGEPDATTFVEWCRSVGKTVVFAEPRPDATFPVDAGEPDVVIVPGLGFTPAGARLGQGGGWYDRFLAGLRSDATVIGVGFAEQVVDELPTESHDAVLDVVVTDEARMGGE